MVERFIISGQLAQNLPSWIEGHAARIGVEISMGNATDRMLEVCVDGPPALLDAMEMGCLLGPIDVWVDDIRREAA